MSISRRYFCYTFASLAVTSQATRAEDPPLHPLPDTLRSGDFLCSKPPCVLVPFKKIETDGVPENDQEIWENEKRTFLERAKNGQTSLTPEQLAYIESLDFKSFMVRYNDQEPIHLEGFSFRDLGLYCGHAAIVDVDSTGHPAVIEALWQKTVVSHSYNDFVAAHPEDKVWHGRLRDHTDAERALISAEARRHINAPYEFFNFDLNDDSGFYCSKLPWLCIYRALGFAVDDDPNPKRGFWFTPKQFLYLPKIEILLDHGSFAGECF